MNNSSPIFAIQPHHFSDYGFDPQIDYFQVLEEARKHKRETSSSSRSAIDSLHFKLQKPISKDYESNKKIKKTRKRWWWKNALHFFKRKRSTPFSSASASASAADYGGQSCNNHHPHCVYGGGRTALSGPVYITESRSGSATPYHRTITGRPLSGPIDIPYVSLRELNMDETHRISASAAAMPIYLVT